MDEEEKAIMNYIVSRKEILRLKGDQLWKELEEQKVVNRTWQNKYSLSRKTIDEINVWIYNQPPEGKKYANFMNQSSSSSDSDKTPQLILCDLKGTDYFGNKYYEIPANPSIGKRRASRWFEPPEKENFQQERPAEWDSWLRGRRAEPPSEEEVMRNLAIMQLKKKNAIAVEAKAGKKIPMEKGFETFPQRPEYEIVPGDKKDSK